jgi:thymidylate synthase (FAD)
MIEVTYIDHMGSDETVVNAARVSFAKTAEKYSDEQNYDLIEYLGRNGHTSPFGHCFATFHVKAPVFVARQLVKHKFLRWNEVSRRYVDARPEFYVPQSWRGRSADKKQGSSGEVTLSDYGKYRPEYFHNDAIQLYIDLLSEGVCPEQARMVLPQSMMTEWYWSGTMKAFHKMCSLRCKPDTQLETQIVANHIDEEMAELFPISWEALRAYED